jgi:hypothetical protein
MGRPRRNRYSSEFRVEAIRLVRSSPGPLAKVAWDLGVPSGNPPALGAGDAHGARHPPKATAFFAKQSE